MIRFSLLAALLLVPILAWAPTQPDLALLREVTCKHETRGETVPNAALGSGGEIGRCQIKPLSAVRYGGQSANAELSLIQLLIALVLRPEPIAEEILRYCAARIKIPTAFKIAACYNGGPNAARPLTDSDRYLYAKQIATDYAAARLNSTKTER